MKNIKTNKNLKKIYIVSSTIILYLLILTVKNVYYGLFNLNLNKLSKNSLIIANITYHIFALAITINFFIKNTKKELNELKEYLKLFKTGLVTIFIYAITSIVEIATLSYQKSIKGKLSMTEKSITLITIELIIMLLIIIVNKNSLKKDLKEMKKKWKEFFEEYLKYYILSLIIMMVSNIFIQSLYKAIPGNEESIRQTLKITPIYMFFSSVIVAPFTEEMVFRRSIKNIITNKKIFVLTSGLIFGGLHVIGHINSFYDILYIIPYSTPGIAFAYMLVKTDNILISMGIHFLHNFLLMSLQIISTLI